MIQLPTRAVKLREERGGEAPLATLGTPSELEQLLEWYQALKTICFEGVKLVQVRKRQFGIEAGKHQPEMHLHLAGSRKRTSYDLHPGHMSGPYWCWVKQTSVILRYVCYCRGIHRCFRNTVILFILFFFSPSLWPYQEGDISRKEAYASPNNIQTSLGDSRYLNVPVPDKYHGKASL